ncbi:dihydroorotate dehydrogenase [miscellaneous Crenarchaeota group-15 archaeon DG-45]|uniref:Dihydroorotate dehydrogenase B (NAD(+)), catalytic subunit n=1 Tax=miscellaneous Crenarchaeota group-15 archaeon DG-45 TaxID=1685127 RepID=A0A0M0BRZ6_9ARCH|nr:MAG: dihydroorotate dehydrogenase [miscellaneous Crenarchaeota group-15 archaeon DG-45]
MPDLSVEFAGVHLRNPIIAASATPTWNADAMKRAVDAGFGGVVAKSLFGDSASTGRRFPRPRFKLYGWREHPGYPDEKARCFTLHSLEDCSPFGYEEYAEDIDRAKGLVGERGAVIASISGSSFEEWEELCDVVNGTEADMCEVNISCPFAADMGLEMGAGAAGLTPEIAKVVDRNLAIPFSAKLTPEVPDLVAVARGAEAAGADALTVQARISGIMIDIESAAPVGWGSIGGYGGPYLLGYGLKGVSAVASEVGIPVCGVSGVWDWEDIVRYVMVGAAAVQSATAVMLRGYAVAGRWLRGITGWMEGKGYEAIRDLRGAALGNIRSTRDVARAPEGVHVAVEKEKCIGCGECVVSCFYDAVALWGGKAVIDRDACDVCGMCLEKCPTGAVHLLR